MLVVVGLCQRSACEADRALLALPTCDVELALAGFLDLGGIDGVAVLSTGYRVEIYAGTRCPAAALVALRRALCARAGHDLALLELQGREALRHLVRVTSGLDSPILAEPRIAAQVDAAFERAIAAGSASDALGTYRDRAREIAGRIRAETGVGHSRVCPADAVAALAEKVLGPRPGRRVAFVGVGEMSKACAEHFTERGASIVVLDAVLATAHELATGIGAETRPLDALDEELLRADIVVSAAAIAPPALGPDAMARTARARRRPIVVVDLSAARPIPAQTGLIRDVYLCDLDDLERMMRSAMEERAAAALHAERVLDRELARWGGARPVARVTGLGAGDTPVPVEVRPPRT